MVGVAIWGRKTYERPDGFAADFCPICRCAVSVWIGQIYSQRHINFVPFGPVKLMGRTCTCRNCHNAWPLAANTIESSLPERDEITLETLLAETYPHFMEVNRERLEWETSFHRNPAELSPSIRMRIMTEIIAIVVYTAHRKINNVHSNNGYLIFDGLLTCLGQCIVLGICISTRSLLPNIFFFLAFVAILQLASLTYLPTPRVIADILLYPRLVPALAPLQPSREELATVLASSLAYGEQEATFKILKHVKLDHLMELLNNHKVAVSTAR